MGTHVQLTRSQQHVRLHGLKRTTDWGAQFTNWLVFFILSPLSPNQNKGKLIPQSQ